MSQERDPRCNTQFCETSVKFHKDLQSLVLRFVENGGAIIPAKFARLTAKEALADAIEAMEDADLEEEYGQ